MSRPSRRCLIKQTQLYVNPGALLSGGRRDSWGSYPMSSQRYCCGQSDYCIITYSISVSCGCVDAVCVCGLACTITFLLARTSALRLMHSSQCSYEVL